MGESNSDLPPPGEYIDSNTLLRNMKRISPIAPSIAFAFISITSFAQVPKTPVVPSSRPRTVTTSAQTQLPAKVTEDQQDQNPMSTPPKEAGTAGVSTPEADALVRSPQATTLYLTPAVIQSRISEAQRLLKSRPLATAMTTPSIEFVTVAALDSKLFKNAPCYTFERGLFEEGLRDHLD